MTFHGSIYCHYLLSSSGISSVGFLTKQDQALLACYRGNDFMGQERMICTISHSYYTIVNGSYWPTASSNSLHLPSLLRSAVGSRGHCDHRRSAFSFAS
jgi:hypothetical protein